jgi:glycosyltransferase involved in cell wall biosynthesis
VARGHHLTCLAPRGLDGVERTVAPEALADVPRTWSDAGWFGLAARNTWRVQRWLGVPYLNVFSNWRRFDACLRCLPGHDVVYERNGLYHAGVAMACRRLGLPFILFFDADQIAEHDFLGTPITGLLRWRGQRLLRYNLHVADAIICVSDLARARLTSVWGVPAGKVAVFPNAVDTSRFMPSPDARSEVRAALGLGEGPVAIFVGSFYDWHDVGTLLDAFALALSTCPGARLLLVGDGGRRETMQHRAATLGIAAAVRFTGPVAHRDVPRLIAAADVAVAPVPVAARDSWLSPMKVFEYMASGTAIIASRAGQIATVIGDGVNGRLVPPGDALAMAATLSELMKDAGQRRRLGAQARKDAVERHSWERYVSRLERVFTAVIAGEPADRP